MFLNIIYFNAFTQVDTSQNYNNDVITTGGYRAPLCPMLSSDFTNKYGMLQTYVPTSTTPVVTIKVNLNIFQNGSGGGNFQDSAQDGGIDKGRLNLIFAWFKNFYSNTTAPYSLTGAAGQNSYITYELEGIYFYNNAALYYTTSTTSLITEIGNTDPARLKSLNICFNGACYLGTVTGVTISPGSGGSGYTSSPTVNFSDGGTGIATISGGVVTGVTSISGTPTYSGVPPTVTFTGGGGSGASGTVNYAGASAFTTQPTFDITGDMCILMLNQVSNPTHNINGDYAGSSTMAHEVGHTLDLCHTYSGGGCSAYCGSSTTDPEYFDDIFGTYPSATCPHLCSWPQANITNIPPIVTNDLMGGNQAMGYMSPKQIGVMHRSLALKTIRRYAKEMVSSTNNWVVSTSETWDFDIQFYQDILVTNGATLTINCRVLMANNGKITVDPGAHLILDGATLTSWGSMWTGVVVNLGSTLFMDNSTIL